MKDVLKTDNPVTLSFARSVLDGAGIANFVLDAGMASLYGGGITFVEQRLAVADEDEVEARRLLGEALKDDA
jgi:hypothetical protein